MRPAGIEVQDDIFGADFLLERPLLTAISSTEPVVLLIDEIDKTDQEFEAMLLELLSDFQITIPELGRIEARTHPVVLLTSNNSRELTEALKRRCLYLWLDYPDLEHELEIVRMHSPELSETVARKLVEVVQMVRELDLKKPPSIAESIDWARALLLLGASDIDQDTFRADDERDRQASDRPRHRRRAGRRQAGTRAGGLAGRALSATLWAARTSGTGSTSTGSWSRSPRISRSEGVAVGTSELLDSFEALELVDWSSADAVPRDARDDDRQVARGSARVRPRVRPLLLPRHGDAGGSAGGLRAADPSRRR